MALDLTSFLLAVLILIFLLIFLFAWWWIPKRQLPPDASDQQIKRFEAEDKLRQTIGQLVAGIGLLLTFGLTVTQMTANYRQWNEDFSLRTDQERVNQFSEALKALDPKTGKTVHIAGIYTLYLLATEVPKKYAPLVTELLASHVRQNTAQSAMWDSGLWSECLGKGEGINNGAREESDAEVQAAMNVLGDHQLAPFRRGSSTRDSPFKFGSFGLDHLHLDNLNLAGSDFSGAAMSQAHLHRVNFNGATLVGTDFRGAEISDWDVPGWEKVGLDGSGKKIAKWLYLRKNDDDDSTPESEGGAYLWRRYRCWVTDFRNAHLEGALFTGAHLAGADFSGAHLKGADFTNAEVTDANFRGTAPEFNAKEQLKNACASTTPLLDDSTVQLKTCPE